ncbi:PLP-dependent transferase [Saccharata proteae CBS 121410]|uniref:PLP-dependent transferase n=1 Tax=Saccharata proteae CBS 121410 TaxID=1314787 RepID=A0A9P4HRD3_9PEZI|nr:PLP-dependent transferase [Saccharata proteae CBS 121410]
MNTLSQAHHGISIPNDEPQAVLPSHEQLTSSRNSLVTSLPDQGQGFEATARHLLDDIVPGLNANSKSPNYYGFVTGGATPAAAFADNIVTAWDQNVQVHLPNETVATDVEDCAFGLLCQLLKFTPEDWPHRTFTTGATASNVIGLACAREHVIAKMSGKSISVGEVGLMRAMRDAGVDDVQILTTVPHSSLSKAASIVGLGRASVKLLGRAKDDVPHLFDFEELERQLNTERIASIVAVSCSEVNTGRFATAGYSDMKRLRDLCDRYGAWIHVDAAFGLLGRILDTPEFAEINQCCAGMELADSITGDCHKLLNVPYDCGFFLSHHLPTATSVFQNPNAAYLSSGPRTSPITIPSPLNIGIENSRRFRALPVYATLTAYGLSGHRDMLERQIRLSRSIAAFVDAHPGYELLPAPQPSSGTQDRSYSDVFVIVLFRARDGKVNEELVERINGTGRVYVSGTRWEERPACRFAVANWRVQVDRDLDVVRGVLEEVARG